MDLIPAAQKTAFETQLLNLWDTLPHSVTIVKTPVEQPIDVNQPYMAGYGHASNPTNYSLTPESRSFACLAVDKLPNSVTDSATQKQVPIGTIYLKVQTEAKNYILDGRPNLHAVYEGNTYNIASKELPVGFLGLEFFIFKLELIT